MTSENMMFIFFIALALPSTIFGQLEISSFRKIYLPKYAVGPESISFDAYGRGPYTSISDGRIVKYNCTSNTFEDYSFTHPNRSKSLCDGHNNDKLGPTCGRPLGIEFYVSKNKLFIADAYLGLLVVGLEGGLATQLATSADGVPFRYTDGLSIDQVTGDIYFTDLSSRFQSGQFGEALRSNDKTGRLLKYDQTTGKVRVLLRGLAGANGVAISSDRSFLLVAESFERRIVKLWLKGYRASTSQVVLRLDGIPDNIKRTPFGDQYWLAVNYNEPDEPETEPNRAIKIDGEGRVLEDFNLGPYYNTTQISEFYQSGDQFFGGSSYANYVGVFY